MWRDIFILTNLCIEEKQKNKWHEKKNMLVNLSAVYLVAPLYILVKKTIFFGDSIAINILGPADIFHSHDPFVNDSLLWFIRTRMYYFIGHFFFCSFQTHSVGGFVALFCFCFLVIEIILQRNTRTWNFCHTGSRTS